MTPGASQRIGGLVAKDLAELSRNPGATVPPILTAIAAMVPAFLITIVTPKISGEHVADAQELQRAAQRAAELLPELGLLAPNAQVQAFMFQQFALFLLLVPVVGSMALAAHAIIGEKIARTLEPLLATPISTIELLVAKTSAPFALTLALMWATLLVYVGGIAAVAEPDVWRALVGTRVVVMFFVVGPLISLVSLQLAIVISLRVNDPRSAQQLGALIILPVTGLFVAQLMGGFVVGVNALLAIAAGLAVVNAGLLYLGARVFQRENILMRWK
ncbi:MAG TPA: hypothetical protein VEK56_08190 [Vicinamibacterales bacterium]|nr:hypothetical protein [Vicinamibacterales bacterium]